ncbi:hypothetical protein [Chitinophaga ginsengisoli]|uniref:Uncharacterized protein n=1 Tax=Chitinophaga ginsengisoli TaxID=363837 RepID=A0A2P8FCZ8_9BACT|nr:hypothetical protein [Chitinophaga ginsengisoli]PSL19568.1 hypothetical protein CLV42_12733 [Chitinophaga ginsengisoli]
MNTTIPLYLLLAYGISTPCFLVMAVFNSHLRKMRPRYLSTANIIAALAAFLMIVFLVTDLRNTWQLNHSAGSLPFILFLSAACLLTLSRKLRRSVLFTLILIAIYAICIFREAIYIFFTGFSRDYLPSGWAHYYSTADLYIFVYAAVYLAICYFIAAKPVSRSSRR